MSTITWDYLKRLEAEFRERFPQPQMTIVVTPLMNFVGEAWIIDVDENRYALVGSTTWAKWKSSLIAGASGQLDPAKVSAELHSGRIAGCSVVEDEELARRLLLRVVSRIGGNAARA